MRNFLDTADQWAIQDYYETGLIDGVTTNPTLIVKVIRILTPYIKPSRTLVSLISAWKLWVMLMR